MSPDGDIQVLFRFRDLIADTLTEHRKVIEEHKACWWGWWKRPHEDPHHALWADLKKATSSGKPVTVGLFHSGTGQVHFAEVQDVIGPGSADERVRVPEGEENLIPDYYRKSPFSRAWLRITKIGTEPIQFFGDYSFASVPQIPNYSAAVLKSLQNKVIVDAQELRSMDATIWEVRRKVSGDSTQTVLLTTRSIGKAISREPIETQSNVVVHISDPHFAMGDHRGVHVWRLESEQDSGRATLAEAIANALDGRRIGLVVVTGDFTFTGAEREYAEAATFLQRLAGIWSLDMDRFVIIPGNHDIQWAKGVEEKYDEGAVVDLAPEEAQVQYRRFYRGLFGHDLTAWFAMGRRFVLPCGLALEICGVNSSSLEQGKNFLAGMGRVQENSFVGVANELGWKQAASLSLRVLALHHHLALTDNLEEASSYSRGFGIAIDAPRIQRLAAQRGVQLVLHGHKHRAFIWRSGVYELPEHAQTSWRLGDLSIVGGGSAGSRETEGKKNYFNVFEAGSDGLTLEIFRAEAAGAFDGIQSWKAGFTLDKDPSRLNLGDWEVVSR
jgi:3',5'-cyclic AMP phosphodiesterase CpdA